MKFSELVHSSGWKNFMAKLYGIGASIVILGALFKIQHWSGAGIMLTVGLSVEALIFFFSAFEPLHEELDWTLVYPELAGMQDENSSSPALRERRAAPAIAYQGDGGGGSAALARFDQMLENAELTPEVFDRLGQSLKSLNMTAAKLADISDASLATSEYVSNIRNAAISVNSLTESFEDSSNNLRGKVDVLSESYRKNSEVLESTTGQLNESFGRLGESVRQESDSIMESNKTIGEKLGVLNKNLAALNAVYELQLQNNNDYMKNQQALYNDFGRITDNLKSSAQETEKCNEEITRLSRNLSELNSIYGNMLSAMSVVSRKK